MSTTKVVYLEKSDIGSTLTTYVYCNMWQLWAAERMGLRGFINWPNQRNRHLQPYSDPAAFARCPNMFEWYFEQPLFPQGSSPQRDLTWEWEHCPELGQHPFMGQPLDVIRAWYQTHLRFNADVNARGQALVAKYGIDFDRTIGITWRGTDCVTDGRPRTPIQAYFPFIDAILEKEPGLCLMCTAEEERILDPLLARYSQAFKVEEFFSSPLGHMHNPERFSPFSGYERGMQPALMVWLFSKCAHYIKNRSSSGGVAAWLSNARTIVCLGHTQMLGYGEDVAKAEVNRVLVPMPC